MGVAPILFYFLNGIRYNGHGLDRRRLNMDLPEAFVKRMTTLLEDEAISFFKTYERPKTQGLRYNPLKITLDRFRDSVPFHIEPVPFCHTGFSYNSEDTPGKHPYHQAGLYYIQEPSAMAAAEVLEVKPGDRVLDLCAAPGGKSTQLAGALKGKGILVSNEYVPKRAKILSENIERLGVTNAVVTNESPERLAPFFEGWFDRILVDAPCSGEGMFRKDPEACSYWSPDHVLECAALQETILDQAYKMLKSGGTLVYSTCTFSPKENEQTIERFIEKYPDMSLLPLPHHTGISPGRPDWTASMNPDLEKTGRLWPHKVNGEGHFVAKLTKTGATEQAKPKPLMGRLSKSAYRDVETFIKNTLVTSLQMSFIQQGQQVYGLPQDFPDLSGLKVVRQGLHLGELKKNRFEPNHAWALALQPGDVQRVHPLASKSEEWRRYLRGEALPTHVADGWTLVLIDGYSLGWGKAVQGTLKNFYPKGLRRP
jgi:NOL1/NOP2/sun family putative RNA methylase